VSGPEYASENAPSDAVPGGPPLLRTNVYELTGDPLQAGGVHCSVTEVCGSSSGRDERGRVRPWRGLRSSNRMQMQQW
jgi:hypothetical protein